MNNAKPKMQAKLQSIIAEKQYSETKAKRALALELDVTEPTITKIVTADNWPQYKTYSGTVVKIAKGLGVSVGYLFGENNK